MRAGGFYVWIFRDNVTLYPIAETLCDLLKANNKLIIFIITSSASYCHNSGSFDGTEFFFGQQQGHNVINTRESQMLILYEWSGNK